MFDANLCGVKLGRKVLVKFHGDHGLGSLCPIEQGVYEAEVLASGRNGYDFALIKVRISESLTMEIKDIDTGNRMVSYEGEIE
jgi:hypothetical protein